MNDYTVAAYDLRGFGESEIPQVRLLSALYIDLNARGSTYAIAACGVAAATLMPPEPGLASGSCIDAS